MRNPEGFTLHKADDERGWIIMDCGPLTYLGFGENKALAEQTLQNVRDAYIQGRIDMAQDMREAQETMRDLLNYGSQHDEAYDDG